MRKRVPTSEYLGTRYPPSLSISLYLSNVITPQQGHRDSLSHSTLSSILNQGSGIISPSPSAIINPQQGLGSSLCLRLYLSLSMILSLPLSLYYYPSSTTNKGFGILSIPLPTIINPKQLLWNSLSLSNMEGFNFAA